MKTGIKRNDPCDCGSGKKYKRCCLNAPFYLYPKKEYPPADTRKGALLVATMVGLAASLNQDRSPYR